MTIYYYFSLYLKNKPVASRYWEIDWLAYSIIWLRAKEIVSPKFAGIVFDQRNRQTQNSESRLRLADPLEFFKRSLVTTN